MNRVMLSVILLLFTFNNVFCYFTLPGKCPDNIKVQDDFRLADFYELWHQSYHYSSDGQTQNNCSTVELLTKPTGINVNISRIDRGLFHRYSVAELDIPIKLEEAAKLQLVFQFKDAPRRLKTRRYPFYILATNYNYYATVYTCQYSELINKHFIYVWILSRQPTLNDVSKELAMKPLKKLGIHESSLIKDENNKCTPKYYEDRLTEPMTFRYAVPIV